MTEHQVTIQVPFADFIKHQKIDLKSEPIEDVLKKGLREQMDWCDEHTAQWTVLPLYPPFKEAILGRKPVAVTFGFTNPVDAVFFKLRWF